MRIVLVTNTYPPENGWGGIGTYVYNHARGLHSLGHEITVVCSYSCEPGTYRESGIEVHRVLDERQQSTDPLEDQVLRHLSCLIESEKATVVEFPDIGAFGLRFQRARPDFPAVIRLHGDSEHLYYASASRPKRHIVRTLSRARLLPAWLQSRCDAEKEAVRRAHVVVSPSKWMVRSCIARGWQFPLGYDVIPNPLLRSPDAPRDSQNSHSSSDVLWLGRLDPVKGVDLLPAIAGQLWSRIPEAKFHVIGQFGQRGQSNWGKWVMDRIPPDCRHKISLYGGLPHGQVRKELRRFGIAVFASSYESLCYTLMECMAERIACVTASEGGAREIGEHGRSVYHVRRHPAAIAQAIAFLVQNPLIRSAIGVSARQFVDEHYGNIAIAEQMTTVYRRAIDLAQGLSRGTPALEQNA